MSEELEVKRDGELQEEQGASMVEYALLVALIAVVAIVSITILGQRVSTSFSTTAHAMS